MKNEIKEILENEFWGYYDMSPAEVTDKIWKVVEFNIHEYTNFIHQNYKPFGGDWVRISDDRIIYNCAEIMEDFLNSRS